jgi:hypothetical protein
MASDLSDWSLKVLSVSFLRILDCAVCGVFAKYNRGLTSSANRA